MSARKVKSAMVRRVMENGYRGFMPVKEKIQRDLRSIRLSQKND